MTRVPDERCPGFAPGPAGWDVRDVVGPRGGLMTSRAHGFPPGVPGSISTSTRGGVLVVRLSGEVDIAVRSRLPAVLEEVRWHPGPVELDLESVTFFGAEGVRALLALLHARPPGVVALASTSRAVEFTLRACRLSPDRLPRAQRGP